MDTQQGTRPSVRLEGATRTRIAEDVSLAIGTMRRRRSAGRDDCDAERVVVLPQSLWRFDRSQIYAEVRDLVERLIRQYPDAAIALCKIEDRADYGMPTYVGDGWLTFTVSSS
jgi:hypothetical protein